MKSIKGFLRQIDVFSVPLSFRYKGRVYYSTSLGGLFIILFIIVILVVGIYYFIPFMERKNFTVVYYTMNLSKTEQIKFKESKAAFAYGLICEKEVNGLTVMDVFKLESKFIVYTKKTDGTFYKDKRPLTTHACGYADFYYNYNNSVDYLNLDQFQCLDNNDHILEGIFSDQVFSYYEFGASAKTGTEQNFNDIDNFLLYNDCKFQFYYTDITFDLVDYEEPIKPYLNTLFIQFDPTLFIKRNIFFMNQYLYNDDYLIWNFGDDDVPEVKTLFSRYEEYALYQGMNRTILKPPDYMNYAKMYLRADTRRTDVKRKYQKLMEFYADLSSLMITLYRLMTIFFNFVNTFYAMHSVSKRIFFFKEIEKKHFNIFKKSKDIHELIYLTDTYSNDGCAEPSFETELKKIPSSKKVENEKQTEEKKLNQNEYKNYRDNNLGKKQAPPPRNNYYKRENESKRKYEEKDSDNSIQSKIMKYKNDNINRTNAVYKRREDLFDEDENINKNINSRNNGYIYNMKQNYVDKINMNSSERTEMEEYPKRKHRIRKIKYKFNIFEVICASFFDCCLPKNLSRKHNINEKANNILFRKLDIVLFVRNMILIDLINDTMLAKNKKNIWNLICRPVISLNKKAHYRTAEFYQNYRGTDFEKFSESISNIVENGNKDIEEKKLMELANKQLKELL